MESILEELENLPISEECFNDIMDIVEEILSEGWKDTHTVEQHYNTINKAINKRYDKFHDLEKKYGIDATSQHRVSKIPEVNRAHQRYLDAVSKKRTYNARMGLEGSRNLSSREEVKNQRKYDGLKNQKVSDFEKPFKRPSKVTIDGYRKHNSFGKAME